MRVTIVTEAELRRCVDLDGEAIAAVEEGFTKLAKGEAITPPILALLIPERRGEVDVKTAYISGLDLFAIKMASGFFGNQRLGLPSGSGLMVLFTSDTGLPEAVLLDNGYLTDLRTGAAGAVAARYLARQEVGTAGVIGAGAQARYQMRALKQVRNYRRLLVHSITPGRAEAYAAEMASVLGVEVLVAPDAETVVRESDVVVTTTPAHQPVVKAAWLHRGLHITAMGSDTEEKQELEAGVLARADVLVCDLKSQCSRYGELHHALDEGAIPADAPALELGELTSGRKPGRQSEDQITVCDLTGVGVQDTAIAVFAYRRARAQGLGLTIEV